jgi:DNA-binding transcriptional regulator YhcF (GntR family)
MLTKLFGSNTRTKILKNFLLNPDKVFYVRQLSRDLVLPLNSIHRELENLTEFGLLIAKNGGEEQDILNEENDKEIKVSKKKNSFVDNLKEESEKKQKNEKKYYALNKRFVLYEEIKSLIIKSQTLYEKNFVDKIRNLGKINFLLLSGIFVGDLDGKVDLLIVGDFKKEELKSLIKEFEEYLMKEINYVIMDEHDFKYRKEITDVFLYNILDGKNIIAINSII